MYTLKGFFAYLPLVNNSADQVALFGELSADSMTYGKDKAIYTSDVSPQTTLVAFHSINDERAVEVPSTIVTNALKIGQFLYSRAIANNIPDSPITLNQQVNAEFNTSLQDFTCGVISSDGRVKLPEWISYTDTTVARQTSAVTLWLSDASFRSQYPEYEIEVIPPFANLDDFFQDPLKVKAKLDQYNLVTKMDEVQAKRGQYPYTLLRGQEYDYQDPRNPSTKYPTFWLPLIYGQAGNNPDIIRQAIVDFVLENSTHSQDEWVEVLPDLFKTTEFIITPFWMNYSVPNKDYQAGIYSPTLRPAKALELLKKTTKGGKFTEQWIAKQYETSAFMYKSLALGIVGNPDNRGGITQFSEQFNDFMLVTNNSDDFNRMSVATQEFVVLLTNLIKVAETFTQYTSVPVGMARVIREGVVYISAYYDNVNYLVAAKPSIETL